MESSGKTADFSSGFSQEFIQHFTPDCDRRAFIRQYLAENGIQTTEIPIAGKKHIFVNQSASAYSPLFRLKTVIAHYDRASGTPGANDNSSSVFALMDFAIRLKNYKGIHNIRIFFTDGEELDENPEISSSGEESPGCKVNGQSNKQTKNQSGSQIFSRMGAFGLAALFNEMSTNPKALLPSFEDNYHKWLEYMFISFVATLEIPDYDPEANMVLEVLLKKIKVA